MAGVIGTGRVTPPTALASLPSLPIEIAARHEIEPYRQCELDQLCGLLSAVNAIRLAVHSLAPLSKAGSRNLFECGVEYLQRKDGAAEALTSGMGTRCWHGIVRRLAREASNSTIAAEVEKPSFGPSPAIDELLAWVEASIATAKPVLIHLAGGLDHFTVVAGVTPTRLQLFDSCGHRFINRKSCLGPKSFYRIPPKALLRVAVSRRG